MSTSHIFSPFKRDLNAHNDLMNNDNIAFLNLLAGIVSNIDCVKHIDTKGEVIKVLKIQGDDLLYQMQLVNLDIGKLGDIFYRIRGGYECRHYLSVLIEEAHVEISRLLGSHVWEVYGPDDDKH